MSDQRLFREGEGRFSYARSIVFIIIISVIAAFRVVTAGAHIRVVPGRVA